MKESFIPSGHWHPSAKDLKSIWEAFNYNDEDFKKLFGKKSFKELFGGRIVDETPKNIPKRLFPRS